MDTPAKFSTEPYTEAEQVEFKKLYIEYATFRADFHPLADETAVAAHFAFQKMREARLRR